MLCLFILQAYANGEENKQPYSQVQAELLAQMRRMRPALSAAPTADGLPWLLERWNSDAVLEKLLRLPMQEGNAAEHFYRLEELYKKEKLPNSLRVASDSQGVKELLLAARFKYCRLVPDYYPEFDRGGVKHPDFTVYRSYHQALLDAAEAFWRQGKNQEAEHYLQSALLCGWQLANDRSSIVVYLSGIILKLRAAQSYAGFLRLQNRGADADLMDNYISDLIELMQLFYWKSNTLLGSFTDFSTLPCVIDIALRDQEECWRKEAIIRLAVYRHGAPEAGNNIIKHDDYWQSHAEEALANIAENDASPSARRLAAWAVANITPENYKDFKHKFSE